MARPEFGIGAYVNNTHRIINVRWRAQLGRRQIFQQRNAVAIQSFHPREVPWRLWLSIKNVGDEFFTTARQTKCAVGSLLVANGRLRHSAKRFAACTTRAMSWPHLEVVGHGEKRFGARGKLLSRWPCGVLCTRSSFQEIRAAKISHKDKVSSGDSKWFFCPSAQDHEPDN